MVESISLQRRVHKLSVPPLASGQRVRVYGRQGRAPASVPLTLSAPSLVILSPASPVASASATTGAAACVSSLKVRLVAAETLPARSVCRT
jgi:hypothetical protein